MQRKLKCFHWKILIQTLPECSLFNMQYKITGLIFFAFSLQSIKYIQSWWKKNKKNYLQSGVFVILVELSLNSLTPKIWM